MWIFFPHREINWMNSLLMYSWDPENKHTCSPSNRRDLLFFVGDYKQLSLPVSSAWTAESIVQMHPNNILLLSIDKNILKLLMVGGERKEG